MSPISTLEERLSHLEQDLAQLKSQVDRMRSENHWPEDLSIANPWLDGAGMFRDDPLFDDWQRAIAEYRRETD